MIVGLRISISFSRLLRCRWMHLAELNNACQGLFVDFGNLICEHADMDDFMERLQAWLGRVKAKDLETISKLSGVAHGTLINLKYGRTLNPTLSTAEALRRYMDVNRL
jgi:hypothetical protein